MKAAATRTAPPRATTITPEPLQVKCTSTVGPTASVALDDDELRFAPGNLLVAVHQSRAGAIILPPGWQTAVATEQGETTNRILFKQIASGDASAVALTSSSRAAAQTLTVIEFEAAGQDIAWTLDHASARRTRGDAELATLSTGTTDVTDSHHELAVAAFGFLGDPGVRETDLAGGFVRRSAAVSAGEAADRSAHLTGSRILAGHSEVQTACSWDVPRGASALLATFRPVPEPDDPIAFVRVGIPVADTVTVIVGPTRAEPLRLLVSEHEDLSSPLSSPPATGNPVVELSVPGLRADTEYHWGIRSADRTSVRRGRFVTAPSHPTSFTFATAGCGGYRQNGSQTDDQWPMSTHPVWDAIVAHDPHFFMHLGDLHYQDVNSTSEANHLQAYFDVFSSPKQGRVWRRTPMAHMWGDHDFCGDNSCADSAGRSAARAAYRRMAPHRLAWPSGDKPVSFALSWGPRVRFVAPDCRSCRTDPFAPDDASKTMLGPDGKAWLLEQFAAAEANPDVALICFCTEVPWISSEGQGDDWSVYAEERAEIAAYLEANVTTPILGLGSDAHMNAFDDGTNNAWGHFPVLQAGALDRCGSVKGGPYTSGAFPNTDCEDDLGQFALVTVSDDGGAMTIEVSGRRVTSAGVESTLFTESIRLGERSGP